MLKRIPNSIDFILKKIGLVFPQPFTAEVTKSTMSEKVRLYGKGITEYIKSEKRPFAIER